MCELFHALRRWKQCAFLCVMVDLVCFTWVAVLCLEYETPFLIVHKFNGCCFVFRLRVFLGIIIYSYGSCLDALRWKHETIALVTALVKWQPVSKSQRLLIIWHHKKTSA